MSDTTDPKPRSKRLNGSHSHNLKEDKATAETVDSAQSQKQPTFDSLQHTRSSKRTRPNGRSVLRQIMLIIAAAVLLFTTISYGVARWYQHTQKGKPYRFGVTFIPAYASYLGQNPQETMRTLTEKLGVRQFRLVSYWNEIEKSPEQYDFSQLDWQFAEAERVGAKVSLAVGLRQPRWPECHAPSFYDTSKPRQEWEPALESYLVATVSRYKSSPALQSYQLENEFFNHFGECYNFDRDRLKNELNLVKRLDGTHPVIISRSNNYAGLALRPPSGDINGISLYRRVWDAGLTKRYQNYPFPSWHYANLAGAQKLLKGQDSIIHELQMEPWPPEGKNIPDTSLDEQSKTFNAEQFRANIAFAKQTGIRSSDLWGAEYWLYRKDTLKDSSVWEEALKLFKDPQSY